MCHRYLYLKVFMPVLVIGRGCQVLPGQAVSQLFPLADRAEHLALLRQDAALGPGLARSRDACPVQHVSQVVRN